MAAEVLAPYFWLKIPWLAPVQQPRWFLTVLDRFGWLEADMLIRDGSKGTGMRGYATKLKTDDIWNVVNYLRTIGPKPAKSH